MDRRRLQDVGIALLAGVLVAVGPYTPPRLLPSLAAGLAAGLLVLAWRWRRRPAPAAEPPAAPAAIPDRRGPPPLFWLCLVAFAAVFAPTAEFLFSWWTLSIWRDGHGLLTPFVMAYLTYVILRRNPGGEAESSLWGFAFVIAGLSLAVADSVLKTEHLSALALVICLPGLSLLFLGAERTRLLSLPLFVGLFMIPIPYFWAGHLYLRTLTTDGVSWLLGLARIPHLREGTLLTLPKTVFVVSDACSGFSALYAALGLAVILSIYSNTWTRKVGVVLAAFAVAMVSNVLRVFLLVVMAETFGRDLLDTPAHPASGVLTFALVLGLLFLFADRRRLREALS